MKAIVTGGAGFIGHHLVKGLVAAGHEVVVLDDLSSGHRERLDPLGDGVRLTVGDVTDPTALDLTLPGGDVVFHLAADPSVARSVEFPGATSRINVGGTIEVMAAAGRHRVRRVVFASSSAVYGAPPTLPCHEGLLPAPMSPYGASKIAAEHYLLAMGPQLGVETVALRFFNVFGPGQNPEAEYAAVIPKFVTAILDGRPPTIFGSPEISRDFICVGDVVRANLLAASPDAPSGIVCNVATGRSVTLGQLVTSIAEVAGRRVEAIVGPPRAGDIPHSVASVERADELLGFRASVPLEVGLEDVVAWFLRGHR